MIVKSLTLKNFRNHDFLSYNFTSGLNLLTGPNGSGKTNIIESIYYLSLAKSFRINDDQTLIKNDRESSYIDANIEEGNITRKIKVILTKNGHQIFINNKPIQRISELAKVTNVILFEPKDVLIFKGSPKVRRNFLDISISKQNPTYLELISRYDKILKERNELLKGENIDRVLLDATTDMLVDLVEPIITSRCKYLEDINDILKKIARALTGTHMCVHIHYKPFIEIDGDAKLKAKEAFDRAIETDIKKKVTTIGIHREDFSVSLNEQDIGEYGSQGENRIAALALKLSPYFLIEDKDKRPIVALDDVMSELDLGHRQRLITFLKKFEQVFITATRLEVDGSNHYQLKKKDK